MIEEKAPINKIPEDFFIAREKQHRYQVSVTDIETGEVIYLNQSYAGVMCSSEKIKSFGLVIEDHHQSFAWGPVMMQMHDFSMLDRTMRNKLPMLLDELEKLKLLDPVIIKQYRDEYNLKFGKGKI